MGETKIELEKHPTFSHVVTSDETSRPPVVIESRELTAASTGASDEGVGLALLSARWVFWAMLCQVGANRSGNLQVFRPVVRLIMVYMVNHFAFLQGSTQMFRCDKPMLVNIATNICHWVTDSFH